MPRNRQELNREAKVDQILDAAEERLLRGGYDEMSMAAIARDLGLAQNSIYWYFESKDVLLVAVLRRVLERLGETKPPPTVGVVNQVLWGVDYLAEFAPLRATIRDRALRSTEVAAFNAELESILLGLVEHALAPYVRSEELRLAARAFMATVEGSLAAGFPPAEYRRIVNFALQQMIHKNPSPEDPSSDEAVIT